MNICSYQPLRSISTKDINERFALVFRTLCGLSGSGGGGGGTYTLPTASATTKGGIKIGSGLAISGGGVLSADIPPSSVTWSVISTVNDPAASPSTGDKYLIGDDPTSAHAGHDNQIGTWGGASYTYETANAGELLYDASTNEVKKFSGTVWTTVGSALLHQGGDSFGSTYIIGSKDNQRVSIRQNGNEVCYASTNGTNSLTTDHAFILAGTGAANGFIFSDSNSSFFNEGNGFIQFKCFSGRFRFTAAGVEQVRITEQYFSSVNPMVVGSATTINNSAMLNVETTKKGFLPPRVTKAQRNLLNLGISTATLVGGSGYTNGNYTILLTGGSGSYQLSNVVVSGGTVVSADTPTANVFGQYLIGDVLTGTIPGGSGFSLTVTAVVPPTPGLLVWQTDNTPGLRCWNGTNWVRYTETID